MTSALAALPRTLRRVGLPRVPARVLVALVVAAAVALPGWLWFRDSSFVTVRDVFITGLATGDTTRIRSALRAAATDMTTLHVREDALHAAVAAYPQVADLRVDADFPRKLTIEVVEHVPVALVRVEGRRLPASGGGLLLAGLTTERELPLVDVRGSRAGEHVDDGRTLAALQALAAAPTPLRERVARAYFTGKGLTLDMKAGPQLIFGTAERARAKWLAAARVLADPRAAGAVYLDLRIPERVAAGGVAPLPVDEPTAQAAAAAAVVAPITATPAATATAAATPLPTATPIATATPAPTTAPVTDVTAVSTNPQP